MRLDRTALAKGDYDRAGVKPGWVGYYVDPALQRSGREYVDADEAQWAKLEATGGASLEKILESCATRCPAAPRRRARGAPDNAAAPSLATSKCAAAAQIRAIRRRAQFAEATRPPHQVLPRRLRDPDQLRRRRRPRRLVEGGTPPRDWIAIAPEQPPPVPHWAERTHGGGGGGGNGGNGAMATGGAPAAAARIAPVPPPGATARPWSAAAAPPGRAPARRRPCRRQSRSPAALARRRGRGRAQIARTGRCGGRRRWAR